MILFYFSFNFILIFEIKSEDERINKKILDFTES